MPYTFKAFKAAKPNKDKSHTVFIRVIYDRQKKEANTGIRVAAKSFNDNPKVSPGGVTQYIRSSELLAEQYNERIHERIANAQKAINQAEKDGKMLSLSEIKQVLEGRQTDVTSFIAWSHKQIDIEFPVNRKKSRNDTHKKAFAKLKASNQNKDITFSDVNLNLIKRFYNYMRDDLGHKPMTIKINLDCIERMIKLAIIHKKYKEVNPFYHFKKPRKVKAAKPFLTQLEISKIEELTFEEHPLSKNDYEIRRDAFLWQLYMAGARIGDVLFCRIEDIKIYIDSSGQTSYRWDYTMRKSVHTGNPRNLSIKLVPRAVALYHKYKKGRDEGFLFPLMPESMKNIHDNDTEEKIKLLTGSMWRCLQVIKKEIGRKEKLSTHVARYTVANLAQANIMALRDLLGHTSVTITEEYANTLSKEILDKVNSDIWQ